MFFFDYTLKTVPSNVLDSLIISISHAYACNSWVYFYALAATTTLTTAQD